MSKIFRNLLIAAAIFAICYYISQGIESVGTGERSRDVSGQNSYGSGFDTVVLPHLNGEHLQLLDKPKEMLVDATNSEKEKDKEPAGNGFMIVDQPKLNMGHLMAMRFGEGKIEAEKLNRIFGILDCKNCPKKDSDHGKTEEAIVQILNENIEKENNKDQKRSLEIGSQWRSGKRSTISSKVNLGNGLDRITEGNIHRFWRITKVSE